MAKKIELENKMTLEHSYRDDDLSFIQYFQLKFARLIRRVFIDRVSYKLDLIGISQRSLHGYSHFVASREGLFLVSSSGYKKVLQGQFFGLSLYKDSLYCFQAMGPIYSPKMKIGASKFNKGRILRLRVQNNEIVGASICIKGLPSGIHQIDFIQDRLHLIDTYSNRILLVSDDLKNIERYFHPVGEGFVNDLQSGYVHMNSIVCFQGEIYLVLHNGRVSKTSKESLLVKCDQNFEERARIKLNGKGCHDIVFLEDGSFLSCGSARGELIDGANVLAKVGGMYTRGLSVDQNSVVVGSSFYSTIGGPFKRRYVPGKVSFFDRSYNLQSQLDLPAAPTDICKIDGQDLSLSPFGREALETEG